MAIRVLLFGGTGMVGTAFREVLRLRGHSVLAPTRQAFDAASPPLDPMPFLSEAQVVVNAAAVKDGEAPCARKVNEEFPHYLSEHCGRHRIPLIHLSTDGVFAGTSGPYDEEAVPNATTAYGRQKAEGEPSNALVLRFSTIGPERREFSSLLCWFLARGSCEGYVDHLWNGLTSPELARVLVDIVEGEVPSGVRHLHADTVDKNQLLTMLARAFERDISISPVRVGSRDQRLATCHPAWLESLRVRPLTDQIAELPRWCDKRGRCLVPLTAFKGK